MTKHQYCVICKFFDKDKDECTKEPFETQYEPQCKNSTTKGFTPEAPKNPNPPKLPKKWVSSDDGIPAYAVLSPMSVLTNPKSNIKIEIGD